MSLSPDHLRQLVVRPALVQLDLWSRAAENLVMGTAAQESGMRYLKQLGGPAIGLWQMEPATYNDIWERWLSKNPAIEERVLQLVSFKNAIKSRTPAVTEMYGNLPYAAAMCRIFYRRIPAPLPAADDVEGLADYWKQHYNSILGAGKPEQFVRNYQSTLTVA